MTELDKIDVFSLLEDMIIGKQGIWYEDQMWVQVAGYVRRIRLQTNI